MIGKLLVIGFGSIGERHVRCFLKTERCAVSVCDPNPQLRQRAQSEYGIELTYTSLDEAMGDAHDYALIATPAQFHIPMATRLAEAGVHLLIEKPLSVSLEGIRELDEIVTRKGLTAMVAYTHRANPTLISMREQLLSGSYGRPLQVVGNVGQDFAKYRPAYQDTYFARHATGGGAIQDAMTHLVNAGEWLVGPIRQLVVDARHQSLPGVDVEDTVHLMTRHGVKQDVLGAYSLNLHQAPDEFTITVTAEAGTCKLDLQRNRWSCKTESGQPWEHHEFQIENRDEIYIRQANTFFDAVAGQSQVSCTLQEAEQSLRVNLAMLHGAGNTPWLDVLPQSADRNDPVALPGITNN